MRRENFDISDWEYDHSKGTNIHKNGTEYDDDGYNYYGLDKDGYDARGFKIVELSIVCNKIISLFLILFSSKVLYEFITIPLDIK